MFCLWSAIRSLHGLDIRVSQVPVVELPIEATLSSHLIASPASSTERRFLELARIVAASCEASGSPRGVKGIYDHLPMVIQDWGTFIACLSVSM